MAYIPDCAIDRMDEIPATAFKIFTYYCRRADKEGICFPSLKLTSEETHIPYTYVSEMRAKLIQAGWLEITPRGKIQLLLGFKTETPQTYQVSEKSKSTDANVSELSNNNSEKSKLTLEIVSEKSNDVSEKPKTISEKSKSLPCSEPAQLTSPTNQPNRGASDKPKAARQRDLLFEALAEVCGIDWSMCTDKTRGELNQTKGILAKLGKVPADVRYVGAWWYAHDWRGRQGDAPTPSQIRDVWGMAYSAQQPTQAKESENEKRLREIAQRWQREDATNRTDNNQEQTGLQLVRSVERRTPIDDSRLVGTA